MSAHTPSSATHTPGYGEMPFAEAVQEIQAHLATLEGQIAKGFTVLNPEDFRSFLTFFRTAIDQLHEGAPSEHQISLDLSKRLEILAARVHSLAGGALVEVEVPLLSDPITPHEIANDFPPSHSVHRGLVQLDPFCDIVRVKGDGDCLFRAVGAGLLVTSGPRDVLHLRQKITALPIPPEERARYLQVLDRVARCRSPQDVMELLREPLIDSCWVMFLRKLAVYQMTERVKSDPAFRPALSAQLVHIGFQGTVENYLQVMGDHTRHEWGGEPEIEALRGALGIPIEIHDIRAIEKGQEHLARMDFQQVQIVFRPGHYDVALPPVIPRDATSPAFSPPSRPRTPLPSPDFSPESSPISPVSSLPLPHRSHSAPPHTA